MKFDSYAQNQEDVVLQIALAEVKDGFYLDVGAFDPIIDSVTNVFYERGWHGINIEPQPDYFEKLTLARSRDINLNLAVADFIGEANFEISNNPGLSGFVQHKKNQSPKDSKILVVEVKTLTQILSVHRPEGEIHFLKIDVEGAEGQVLGGLDFSKFRPWILVIESHDSQTFQDTSHLWLSLLTSADYLFVYEDGLNSFFLAQEHAELANRFGRIPVLLAGYQSQSEMQLEIYVNNLLNRLKTLELELHEANISFSELSTECDSLKGKNITLNQRVQLEVLQNRTLHDQVLSAIKERDDRYQQLIIALKERDLLFSSGIRRGVIGNYKSRLRRIKLRLIQQISFFLVRGRVREFTLNLNERLKRYPRLRLKMIRLLTTIPFVERLILKIISQHTSKIQSVRHASSDQILTRSIQRLLSELK